MQQVAGDLNKAKRQSSFNTAIPDYNYRKFLAGDKLQQDIFRWLSPPDPWKNHHLACKSRHPESAAWFIQSDTFSEWKTSDPPSSSLWIHGKRPLMSGSHACTEAKLSLFVAGAGKSVFWCAKLLNTPVPGAYLVGQLRNHRGHRYHAESWARIITILLLRF
jgi:hypothetical protein